MKGDPRFWIGVVSRDHVRTAVAGGFIQLGHGKRAPVDELSPGDWLALYSPRTSLAEREALGAFTAIGRVAGGPAYDVEQAPGFRPVRRDVAYLAAQEAAIRPLVPSLDVLAARPNWGVVFRRSVFEVTHTDFERIASTMRVAIDTTPFARA